MAHTFKALTIAEYMAFAAKLPKYCPNTVFNFDGQSYTTPQVVAFVQTVLSTTSAVTTAEGALKAARATAAAAQAKEGVTVKGLPETLFFWKVTVLKRVRSGGEARLTGPFSSPATRPCNCTVNKLASP